jgi:hypothetical protein
MSKRTDGLPERATWIPDGITREQFEEYRRLHLESIRALGLNPNMICANGVRRGDGDTVVVEFIVPSEGWDGSTVPPSEPDPWRPWAVRRGQVTLRVREVEA